MAGKPAVRSTSRKARAPPAGQPRARSGKVQSASAAPARPAHRGDKLRDAQELLSQHMRNRCYGMAVQAFESLRRARQVSKRDFFDMLSFVLRGRQHKYAAQLLRAKHEFGVVATPEFDSMLLSKILKLNVFAFRDGYELFRRCASGISVAQLIEDALLLPSPKLSCEALAAAETPARAPRVDARLANHMLRCCLRNGYPEVGLLVCRVLKNVQDKTFRLLKLRTLLFCERFEEAKQLYSRKFGLRKFDDLFEGQLAAKAAAEVALHCKNAVDLSELLAYIAEIGERIAAVPPSNGLQGAQPEHEEASSTLFCKHALSELAERVKVIDAADCEERCVAMFHYEDHLQLDSLDEADCAWRSVPHYTKSFAFDQIGAFTTLPPLPEFYRNVLAADTAELRAEVEENCQRVRAQLGRAAHLEIGAGWGEFAAERLAREPNDTVSVINELSWERCGVARLLVRARPNALVLGGDIEYYLSGWLPERELDSVAIRFPEAPILFETSMLTMAFLRKVCALLREGGELTLLTDNLRYAQWLSSFSFKPLLASDSELESCASAGAWLFVEKSVGGAACSYFQRMWSRTNKPIYSFIVRRKKSEPESVLSDAQIAA